MKLGINEFMRLGKGFMYVEGKRRIESEDGG